MSNLRHKLCRGLVPISLLVFLHSNPVIAKVVDQVVVVINGEPYTLSDFKDYTKTKMGREFPQGDLNRIDKEHKEVLEEFITEKLLAAEVKQAGIKVSDEEIDEYIRKLKEGGRIGDEDLAAALRREGVTMEKYRAMIRAEIEKSDIINRQVRKKVNITSEDVERYYRLNSTRYKTEDRVRLRHILLSLPEGSSPEREKELLLKTADIQRRAMSGEGFAKLAQEYSEGAGASDGGDIGWIKRGSLLKEIEDIAFNKLSVGEISQPIQTNLGFHLIKLELKEAGKPLPLSEVRAKIKEELYVKALQERFQSWLKTDLRKRHRVDVKLPGVVFRPEDKKDGTVDSLMASIARRNRKEEPGFLSYLNPLSYIFRTTPIEGEEAPGQSSGQNVVSLLGMPLFRTESTDDVPEDVLPSLDEPAKPVQKKSDQKPEESRGFFSSIWNTINPLSSNR